jgi:hypothetical protein
MSWRNAHHRTIDRRTTMKGTAKDGICLGYFVTATAILFLVAVVHFYESNCVKTRENRRFDNSVDPWLIPKAMLFPLSIPLVS